MKPSEVWNIVRFTLALQKYAPHLVDQIIAGEEWSVKTFIARHYPFAQVRNPADGDFLIQESMDNVIRHFRGENLFTFKVMEPENDD